MFRNSYIHFHNFLTLIKHLREKIKRNVNNAARSLAWDDSITPTIWVTAGRWRYRAHRVSPDTSFWKVPFHHTLPKHVGCTQNAIKSVWSFVWFISFVLSTFCSLSFSTDSNKGWSDTRVDYRFEVFFFSLFFESLVQVWKVFSSVRFLHRTQELLYRCFFFFFPLFDTVTPWQNFWPRICETSRICEPRIFKESTLGNR